MAGTTNIPAPRTPYGWGAVASTSRSIPDTYEVAIGLRPRHRSRQGDQPGDREGQIERRHVQALGWAVLENVVAGTARARTPN